MTLFLYTEDGSGHVDGPFQSVPEAKESWLWEWQGSCLWIERHTPQGWMYANAKYLEYGWLCTSKGLRPVPPYRPEFLELSA